MCSKSSQSTSITVPWLCCCHCLLALLLLVDCCQYNFLKAAVQQELLQGHCNHTWCCHVTLLASIVSTGWLFFQNLFIPWSTITSMWHNLLQHHCTCATKLSPCLHSWHWLISWGFFLSQNCGCCFHLHWQWLILMSPLPLVAWQQLLWMPPPLPLPQHHNTFPIIKCHQATACCLVSWLQQLPLSSGMLLHGVGAVAWFCCCHTAPSFCCCLVLQLLPCQQQHHCCHLHHCQLIVASPLFCCWLVFVIAVPVAGAVANAISITAGWLLYILHSAVPWCCSCCCCHWCCCCYHLHHCWLIVVFLQY